MWPTYAYNGVFETFCKNLDILFARNQNIFHTFVVEVDSMSSLTS